MYHRLAVVTVNCTAPGQAAADGIVRGIVAAEVKRQNDKLRAELERARAVEANRDQLQAAYMANFRRDMHRTPGPLQPLQDAWAMVAGCTMAWAELLADKLLAFCLRHHLIEEDD